MKRTMDRRNFIRAAMGGAALALTSMGRAQSPAPNTLPNVIFLMADDMGFGDPRCNNALSKIPTPNLDRLALEGMRFTDAHSPSAVCTPTRYGVLTGRYCWRSRLKRGVLMGYDKHLISPDRLTIADVMGAKGYHTGIVGKWHLGLDWALKSDKQDDVDFSRPVTIGPVQYGFDYSYLVPASLDMAPYVYVENNRPLVEAGLVEQPALSFPTFVRKGPRAKDFDMAGTLDHLTEKACGYISQRASSGKPFFLYFPLTSPHKPAWPHPRFEGQSGLGPYGDFIIQTDWTIGQVLKALDDAKIADNTLIIVSSDNGSYMYRRDADDAPNHVDDPSVQAYRADQHRANSIYRGTKADIWEAGHRVPFLARWPAQIAKGSRCEETICHTDLMATFAEITGYDLPDNAGEDSFSFAPLLKGQSRPTPRPPVIHHSVNGTFAIRDGNWKLVASDGSGGREKPAGKPFQKPFQLFDLSRDPMEKNNVIDDHPEEARKLEEKLRIIRSSGHSRGV